jgi:hypothetical protein
LNWKGEEFGPKRLSAVLLTESGEKEGTSVTLEVPLNFVEPVRLGTDDDLKEPPDGEIWIGSLGDGDSRTVRLIVWSSTRDHFGLNPSAPADPHLGCGPPERLDAAACERLGRRAGRTVGCAYRVPVTVHERTAGGQELDLGRFTLPLQFASDPGVDAVRVALGGMVRGKVGVGGEADRGQVALGIFMRDQGKSGAIALSTADRTLDLRVERAPDFLKVDLRPDKAPGQGGKTWRLTVTVPPDSLLGPIPPNTAVVLRTTGVGGRRIRVPVTGIASFQ